MTPDLPNRTFICSVLSVDLVGYSKKSVEEQGSIKERFNQLLSQALTDVPVGDRIILDTGDGAAMSFLGDPEFALLVSLRLRETMNDAGPLDGAAQEQPEGLVRIGINLGPVRLATDLNRRPNIIGDGFNVAERIMSFALPGQVAISRSYYEVVSRLSDEYVDLFKYAGSRTDKHLRDHEIYLVGTPAKSFQPMQTLASALPHHSWPDKAGARKSIASGAQAQGSGGLVGFLEDRAKVTVSALAMGAIVIMLAALLAYKKQAAPSDAALLTRPADKVVQDSTPPPDKIPEPPASQPAAAAPGPLASSSQAVTAPQKPANEMKPKSKAGPEVAPKQSAPASTPAVTPSSTKPAEPKGVAPSIDKAPSDAKKTGPARKGESANDEKPAKPSAQRPPPQPLQQPLPLPPVAPVETPKEVAPPVIDPATLLATPILRPAPEFPIEAAKAGATTGQVQARLTINAKGNVTGVQILESRPTRIFDRATREKLLTWKFNAGVENRTYDIDIGFNR